MKHTEGPWIVHSQSEGGRYITVKAATGRTVARVPWNNVPYGKENETICTDHADACLIAAAPDLLEACIITYNRLETFIGCIPETEHTAFDQLQDAATRLTLAINKAEGIE